MTINSISTYSIFQTTVNDVASVQGDLTSMQQQLSSGQKAQNFAGLGSQTTQYLDLQSKLAAATQYTNNNALIGASIDSTNTAMSNIISIGQNLLTLITSHQNAATGTGDDFSAELNSQWQALSSALNTTSNGQYIFSGTRTDTPAVDPNTIPTSVTPDAASYYQGSDQDLTAQVQSGVNMTYNVKASDPSFQQLIAGLATAYQSASTGGTANLDSAYNLVQEGVQGITNLQSQVNTNKVALSSANTNITTLQTYWTGLQQSIGNTDIVSVSTQVAVDQGILQAAFQAFAKINSLNLASFLQ